MKRLSPFLHPKYPNMLESGVCGISFLQGRNSLRRVRTSNFEKDNEKFRLVEVTRVDAIRRYSAGYLEQVTQTKQRLRQKFQNNPQMASGDLKLSRRRRLF